MMSDARGLILPEFVLLDLVLSYEATDSFTFNFHTLCPSCVDSPSPIFAERSPIALDTIVLLLVRHLLRLRDPPFISQNI